MAPRARSYILQPRWTTSHASVAASTSRPHLIVSLIDDVGYNDVGWRNPDVHTPFIDSLLRSQETQTVELLRHYTFAVCSPTRASMLTGRLPSHSHPQSLTSDL